jgi:hypothetical protein
LRGERIGRNLDCAHGYLGETVDCHTYLFTH